MPELPEVETVCRGLAPALAGRRIAHVKLGRRDLRIPFPPKFAARLTGCKVIALKRRAKYILAQLDNGEVLAIHLGMSGRLTLSGKGTAKFHLDAATDAKHDHVVIDFDKGPRLTFNDPRRFGLMTLIPAEDLEHHKLFKHLGLEPLEPEFTGEVLRARFAGRRTSLKAALLDQRLIVGVGNIYASEALHRARLSPERPAGNLTRAQAQRLANSVREVLNTAIAVGGSTLRDFAGTGGELGYFQHRFAVYDRAGEACLRDKCRGRISRIVQGGRSSFFCPICQR